MAGLFFQQYSKLSVPIPLANLKLWLKADAGITLNGSNVSVWADQSGNGNDAIQSNAINQPLFVADGGVDVNNKPVIRFDGSSDYFSLTNQIITLPRSVFYVYKKRVSGGIWLGLSTSTPNYSIDLDYSDGYFYRITAFSSDRANCGNNSTYTEVCYTTNGTALTGTKFYKNSILQTTFSYDGGSNNTTFNTIGFRFDGLFCDGDIVEIILYDVELGVSGRQQVENYLMTKYGL